MDWIKFSVQDPPVGRPVIAYSKIRRSYYWMTLREQGDTANVIIVDKDFGDISEDADFDAYGFTHWTLVPDPPKEESNGLD